jgi:hypothetical protein
LKALGIAVSPVINALNATHFEFDHREMEDGKMVEKKLQSERGGGKRDRREHDEG